MFPLAVCVLPQQFAAGLFGCSAISTAPNELLALDYNNRPAGIANAIAAAPLFDALCAVIPMSGTLTLSCPPRSRVVP